MAPAAAPQKPADLAQYSQPALDLAKGCALTVVQAAYQLAKSKDVMKDLAELTRQIHKACEPPLSSNDQTNKSPNPSIPSDLGELVRTVCTDEGVRQGSLENAAAKLAWDYLNLSKVHEEAWNKLGGVFVDKYETLKRLAANASSAAGDTPDKGSLLARDRDAARQLDTYLTYLAPANNRKAVPTKELVATKLFDLAATQRAMLPPRRTSTSPWSSCR